jgi:hypothetical protein
VKVLTLFVLYMQTQARAANFVDTYGKARDLTCESAESSSDAEAVISMPDGVLMF